MRADALVDAMTIDEKISQLLNDNVAIARLGIKDYDWWNECLHGVARNGRATVFPQAIAFGASFDPDLVFRVATAISDEARAKFVMSQQNGNHSRYAGLTFWSPNVNIFRDPRWGRGQETYGEDPYLTSRIGVAFVKGLQGDHPKYLKTAACAKHYAVHSGPEALRHGFDAECSLRDLRETYLPAFKALVTEAHVESVMGAYNRTLGEACCASPLLLKDILRDEWGFQGHVVSDCGAIQDIWEGHQLVETPAEAAAVAIKTGTDLNCGSTYRFLNEALEQGIVMEEDVDVALKRLIMTKIRLGFFDALESNPYNAIDPAVVGCEEYRLLSREVAASSIVLVKNKNGALPLKKDIRNLYVTGPQAFSGECLIGNYYGVSGKSVTILDGIVSKVSLGTTVNYKYGYLPYRKNLNPIDWAVGPAYAADATIAVLGIDGRWEGEEGEAIASTTKGDLTDSIRLPENQIEFVRKLRKASEKPLIVLITGGAPIAIPEILELADAVMYVWYPGQEGGNAVGDVLFGDSNPCGRLPFTVPYGIEDLPPFEDYSMKGRTYRYMEKTPLLPFGFGLSYSTFEYGNLDVATKNLKPGEPCDLSIQVANSSDFDGSEIVQVYLTQPGAGITAPLKKLVAFKKIQIRSGEILKTSFRLSEEAFVQYDDLGNPVIRKGDYRIEISGSCPVDRSMILGGARPSFADIKVTD